MSAGASVADQRLAIEPHVFADDLYRDRVVLVSGGGSGIGKCTAWLMARLGAKVIICGRSAQRLEEAAAAMVTAGLSVEACPTDIRDEAAVERLYAHVAATSGMLDLLVNNAGGQYAQAASLIAPKGWRAVVDTNLNGTWLMAQGAATRWISSGNAGSIVNVVASCERGMPGIIHSSAARAGVINLTRTAAVEWAPYGIRINCVAPGVIDTAGLDVYPDEARAAFVNANPQGRLGDPWEVAQAIAYLGSSGASFITGSSLVIDGGGALSGELRTHRPSPVLTQGEAA